MPRIEREIKQRDDAWFAFKLGKPSASGASRLVTSKAEPSKSLQGYAEDLAREIYTGKSASDWGGNAATDFGNEMEAESRAAYEMSEDVDVEQVGFIVDDHDRYLCSPDGLVGTPGGFEAKNKPKLHLKALLYWNKYKRLPSDYIAQCQMSLFVSQRDWWDLYYYSHDLPKLLVRIEPDLKMHRALEMALGEVIYKRDQIVKILEEF